MKQSETREFVGGIISGGLDEEIILKEFDRLHKKELKELLDQAFEFGIRDTARYVYEEWRDNVFNGNVRNK